jgi:hypothetical protein
LLFDTRRLSWQTLEDILSLTATSGDTWYPPNDADPVLNPVQR